MQCLITDTLRHRFLPESFLKKAKRQDSSLDRLPRRCTASQLYNYSVKETGETKNAVKFWLFCCENQLAEYVIKWKQNSTLCFCTCIENGRATRAYLDIDGSVTDWPELVDEASAMKSRDAVLKIFHAALKEVFGEQLPTYDGSRHFTVTAHIKDKKWSFHEHINCWIFADRAQLEYVVKNRMTQLARTAFLDACHELHGEALLVVRQDDNKVKFLFDPVVYDKDRNFRLPFNVKPGKKNKLLPLNGEFRDLSGVQWLCEAMPQYPVVQDIDEIVLLKVPDTCVRAERASLTNRTVSIRTTVQQNSDMREISGILRACLCLPEQAAVRSAAVQDNSVLFSFTALGPGKCRGCGRLHEHHQNNDRVACRVYSDLRYRVGIRLGCFSRGSSPFEGSPSFAVAWLRSKDEVKYDRDEPQELHEFAAGEAIRIQFNKLLSMYFSKDRLYVNPNLRGLLERARQNDYFGFEHMDYRDEDPPLKFVPNLNALRVHKVRTIAIKAPMGSGKTEAVVRLACEMLEQEEIRRTKVVPRIIVPVPRISLAQNLHKRFQSDLNSSDLAGLPHPRQLHVNMYRNHHSKDNPEWGKSMIVTLNSMKKLRRVGTCDLLFIDEVESVLNMLQQSILDRVGDATSSRRWKGRRAVFDIFKTLVSRAKIVVASDANLSDRTLHFLSALRINAQTNIPTNVIMPPRHVFLEMANANCGVRAVVVNRREDMMQSIVKCLKDDLPVVCVCALRRDLESLEQLVLDAGVVTAENSRFYSSRTDADTKTLEWSNPNTTFKKLKLLAYTSAVMVGVDFSVPDFFSTCFVLYPNNARVLPREVVQMMFRVRKLQTLRFYCELPSQPSRDSDPNLTLESLAEAYNAEFKVLPYLNELAKEYTDGGFVLDINDVHVRQVLHWKLEEKEAQLARAQWFLHFMAEAGVDVTLQLPAPQSDEPSAGPAVMAPMRLPKATKRFKEQYKKAQSTAVEIELAELCGAEERWGEERFEDALACLKYGVHVDLQINKSVPLGPEGMIREREESNVKFWQRYTKEYELVHSPLASDAICSEEQFNASMMYRFWSEYQCDKMFVNEVKNFAFVALMSDKARANRRDDYKSRTDRATRAVEQPWLLREAIYTLLPLLGFAAGLFSTNTVEVLNDAPAYTEEVQKQLEECHSNVQYRNDVKMGAPAEGKSWTPKDAMTLLKKLLDWCMVGYGEKRLRKTGTKRKRKGKDTRVDAGFKYTLNVERALVWGICHLRMAYHDFSEGALSFIKSHSSWSSLGNEEVAVWLARRFPKRFSHMDEYMSFLLASDDQFENENEEEDDRTESESETTESENDADDNETETVDTSKRNATDKLDFLLGEQSVRKASPPPVGYTGLRNLKNTCFLNAVLQCVKEAEKSLDTAERTITNLLNSSSIEKIVKRLAVATGDYTHYGSNGDQHDAYECFSDVLALSSQAMQEACRVKCTRTKVCLNCREESSVNRVEDALAVNITHVDGEYTTVQSCINDASQCEKVEEYRCEKCENVGDALSFFSILEAPQFLVVRLNRYKSNDGTNQGTFSRDDSVVRARLSQCAVPVLRDNARTQAKYNLIGYIEHVGQRLDSGHYTATVRTDSGWVLLDDANVSSTYHGGEYYSSARVYMLFYRKAEMTVTT